MQYVDLPIINEIMFVFLRNILRAYLKTSLRDFDHTKLNNSLVRMGL